jgi:hypothetical protein
LDHGVQGFIDGADRESLERWVTAYLAVSKLAEHETAELAARLTPVSGFTYSNADTSFLSEQAAPLGHVSYSMHRVADHDGSIGILTLTENDDPELMDRWLTDTLGLAGAGERPMGEGHAGHFVGVVDGDQMHALAWTEAGLSGAFTTNANDLDTAERFLEAFLLPDSTAISGDSGGECASVGSFQQLPLFDDFEGDCRIIDVAAEAGEQVRLAGGSLEVVLSDPDWIRFVDLKSPVGDLSVSASVTMPPEGLVTLECYDARPSLDSFDFVILTTPSEVGVALYYDLEGEERTLINTDVIPREELGESFQIVFTCHSDSGQVDLDGELDWALLEASVTPENEQSTSFQSVGIKLDKNPQAPEPATFILDNLAITE